MTLYFFNIYDLSVYEIVPILNMACMPFWYTFTDVICVIPSYVHTFSLLYVQYIIFHMVYHSAFGVSLRDSLNSLFSPSGLELPAQPRTFLSGITDVVGKYRFADAELM